MNAILAPIRIRRIVEARENLVTESSFLIDCLLLQRCILESVHRVANLQGLLHPGRRIGRNKIGEQLESLNSKVTRQIWLHVQLGSSIPAALCL